MALGIDIYRYQTVTDPRAVKRHGVTFSYVKLTDGGGPAIVRGDVQVRQMREGGIPVGGYHYAQLGDPRGQARVFVKELRRLGATDLPPALDLEDPHRPGAAATNFTLEFLDEMKKNGFAVVCLYANTSMLTGIGAPALFDKRPDVAIWAASYGPNDGRRHSMNYKGKVNIHQFTSVGVIPGISGRVDLNESLIALPPKETDVELTDKIRFWDGFEITVGQALADTWQLANNVTDRPTRPNEPADPPPWLEELRGFMAEARAGLAEVRADVATLKARPVGVADVDEAQLAEEMKARGITGGATPAQVVEILNSGRFTAPTP